MAPVQMVLGVAMGLATLVAGGSPAAGGLAMGAVAFIAIPFGIWFFYLSIVAISEAQEISRGKAAGAILLPIAVCCGLIVIGAVLFGGIAAMSNQ